jgi:hypothetical protein
MPTSKAVAALLAYAEDLGRRNPGLEDSEVLLLCQKHSTRSLTKNTLISKEVIKAYRRAAS